MRLRRSFRGLTSAAFVVVAAAACGDDPVDIIPVVERGDTIGAVLLRAPADAVVAGGDLSDDRTTVNQATGMVIVQADLPHADALAILRARAYATDQPLAEVAAQVVSRRLTFKDLLD